MLVWVGAHRDQGVEAWMILRGSLFCSSVVRPLGAQSDDATPFRFPAAPLSGAEASAAPTKYSRLACRARALVILAEATVQRGTGFSGRDRDEMRELADIRNGIRINAVPTEAQNLLLQRGRSGKWHAARTALMMLLLSCFPTHRRALCKITGPMSACGQRMTLNRDAGIRLLPGSVNLPSVVSVRRSRSPDVFYVMRRTFLV